MQNHDILICHGWISYLKTDGVTALMAAVDISKTKGIRDYVILMLLYSTGIRVSELINLRGRDVSFVAAVYEFIETPEECGFSDIECRLNLVEVAEELFEDGGHAMAWCMRKVK